jgi:hypothetical protein
MMQYILTLILFGHGAAHLSGFLASFTKKDVGYKVDSPWVLPGSVRLQSPLGKIFGIFWLIALFGYIFSAISLLTEANWWITLLIPSAIISLIVILPFWRTVPPGAKFGAAFDVLVLIVMLTPLKQNLINML